MPRRNRNADKRGLHRAPKHPKRKHVNAPLTPLSLHTHKRGRPGGGI